jgi:hypothetical protein
MDDLVKRLRVQADSAYISSMLEEAADRIEELMKYQSLHAGCDKASLDIEQKLVNQLAVAHKRIKELEKKVAELEARPQQTYPLGGAGNHWPFAPDPEQPRWVEQNGKLRFVSPDNVSRETSGDPNEVR